MGGVDVQMRGKGQKVHTINMDVFGKSLNRANWEERDGKRQNREAEADMPQKGRETRQAEQEAPIITLIIQKQKQKPQLTCRKKGPALSGVLSLHRRIHRRERHRTRENQHKTRQILFSICPVVLCLQLLYSYQDGTTPKCTIEEKRHLMSVFSCLMVCGLSLHSDNIQCAMFTTVDIDMAEHVGLIDKSAKQCTTTTLSNLLVNERCHEREVSKTARVTRRPRRQDRDNH